MKLSRTLKAAIPSRRKHGEMADHELAELNEQAILREQSIGEAQAFALTGGFQPIGGKDTVFLGWPLAEEECTYARLGMESNPFSVYCDTQHVCSSCVLKAHATEASSDLPCPLRIPGCRCLTGVGPTNTGNPFMGACVQGTTDERTPVDIIEDFVRFNEDTMEQEAIEGQIEDDDGLLNDSRNTTLLKANQGEEYFRNENKREEVPEDESQLPAPSQPQVDCVDYDDFLGDTPTSDLQGSVATGQHAYNGWFEMNIFAASGRL